MKSIVSCCLILLAIGCSSQKVDDKLVINEVVDSQIVDNSLPVKKLYGDVYSLQIEKSPKYKPAIIITRVELDSISTKALKAKVYLTDSVFEQIKDYHDLEYSNIFTYRTNKDTKFMPMQFVKDDTAYLVLFNQEIIDRGITEISFSIQAHFQNKVGVEYDTVFISTVSVK